MLYGKYAAEGTIDLNKTMKELGLDEVVRPVGNAKLAKSGDYFFFRAGEPDGTDRVAGRESGSLREEVWFLNGDVYPRSFVQ